MTLRSTVWPMFPPTGLAVVGVGIQSALPLGLSKNSDSEHRIRMKGFSYAAEFYHTDYSTHRPSPEQADYHRTLYWNPNLKLDAEGKAQVTFYNNARTTRLSIEAAGLSPDGTILWNKTE